MSIKELMNAINAKREEARELLDKDDLEGAKAAKAELEELNDKLAVMQELEKEGEETMRDMTPGVPKAADPVHEFAEAARHGFKNTRTVSTGNEGTGADGGYTVPEDIQTKINKYKEAHFSLASLVDSENVTTKSGRRTFQKKSQHTGFNKVNEGASIGAKAVPQFEVLEYNIDKYAGYLPVTNELLADSDANITNTMVEWLGEEEVATDNTQIIAKVTPSDASDIVAVADIDDIKDVINVTLGQAYASGVKIITNDDGLNWLDKLKKTVEMVTDEESPVTTTVTTNEYLLKPNADQTSPIKNTLSVGTKNVPVVVVPNSVWASREGTGADAGKTFYPLVIGDLKEFIKIFDRQQLSIATSTQAVVGSGDNVVNAFEMDMTLFRGILRKDYVVKDSDAAVFCEVEISGN